MTTLMRRCALMVAGLGLGGGATNQGRGGITVYFKRAAFESALGTPIATETFDDTTLLSGLSFTSNTGSASINSGLFNDRLAPGENTTFSFVPEITGFGANFYLSPNGAGIGIQITTILPGGGTETVAQQVSNSSTGQFFGFISTGTIVSVRLNPGTQGSGAETYNLDNLTYG